MKFKYTTLKKLLAWCSVASVLAVAVVFGLYRYTSVITRSSIFFDTDKIESRNVALLLGTSPNVRNGNDNPYFYTRINAAVALYKAGKVKKILVSGDNSRSYYNEPADMLKALVDRGVPKEDVILDYAGFRTFDSMVRAKEVFGQSRVIVVSQQFQLERALYIAHEKNMDAIGFAAANPHISLGMKAREILARTRAFLDCNILGTVPHFLGPKEVIEFCS